jgi:hypothetical protein
MSHFNGTIDVTIADAQINKSQLGSKQDPYCVVTLGSSGLKRFMEGETLGKEKFETKVHDNAGQHPIWNETQSMSLKNMTVDSHLKIKLWDKDIGRDDSMGIAKINLTQLLTNDKKGVQYYPIYKKSKLGQPKSGQIGQIGVGVIFHCTEMPSDLKSQATGTMQQVSGGSQSQISQSSSQPSQSSYQQPSQSYQQPSQSYQQPQSYQPSYQQPSYQQQPYQPSYTQQSLGTTGTHMSGQQATGWDKPVVSQVTIPQSQGKVDGHQHYQSQGQQYQSQGQQYPGQQYQMQYPGHYQGQK